MNGHLLARCLSAVLLAGSAGQLGCASAMAELPHLDAKSRHVQSSEPLTTEKVWALDSEELNPHRQRWVIQRQVELKGLKAVPLSAGHFGVSADGIDSLLTSLIRGADPQTRVYRPIEDFRCQAEPVSWFATPEGVRQAVTTAVTVWDEVIGVEKAKLGLLLRRINEANASRAIRSAQAIWAAWLKDVELEWKAKAKRQAREAEWARYLSQAKEAGICSEDGKPTEKASKTDLSASIRWESMMEVPAPSLTVHRVPLARAPARRWDGQFSVRMTIEALGQKLTGQFMVDSTAPVTILSPDWLKGQGLLPVLIEVPRAPLEKAYFSGGSGLARRARIDRAFLAGLELPIQDVLIHDTELFAPPENVATCCSGVLGLDFLRRFTVEFRPGSPTELVVWPKEGFNPGWLPLDQPVWLEAALTGAGEVVSSCIAEPSVSPNPLVLMGIRWNTAAHEALMIHKPWQAQARDSKAGLWEVLCGSLRLGGEILPDLSEDAPPARVPGASVGASLLARGRYVFDLPHGRIWFSAPDLARPIPQNRSGLVLDYDFSGGDRVLRVTEIRRKLPGGFVAPAEQLARAGMKKGTIVFEIDSKPAEDIDLWEVDQRLSGAYGDSVTLKWKSGKTLRKQAVLKLSQNPGRQ